MGINAFGIDIGSGNIKIYNGNNDSFFMEKNMIAIEGKDNLFAYGDSAFSMYEKAPDNITVSYPVNAGVIAEIKNMNTLVHYFINDLCKNNIKPADYYIAVPTDITEVEKRAFYDLVKESNVKARKVYVIEKAVADALGMGIDVKNSQGVLVVDVGFDTTEISILSLGGIVISRLIKVGGNKFDEAIKNAVRKEYNLYIGNKTAEKVKFAMRAMGAENKSAVIYGRDIVTGLPVEKTISTDLVYDCLKELFYTIVDNIKQILERTPPELGADIYHNGIYLTGGASQVENLADIIRANTGLKVNCDDEPLGGVAKGISTIIREERFRSLAYQIEGK